MVSDVSETCRNELEKLEAPYLFAISEHGNVCRTVSSIRTDAPESLTFPIYSVTKTFISVLVLKLVEKGAVGLNDALGKHLANLQDWVSSLTLESLLCHRSGLGDYGYVKAYRDAVATTPSTAVNEDFLINLAVDQGSKFNPGEKFFYSNIGFAFLRQILERYFNDDFASIVNSEISLPMGLENTKVALDLDDMRRIEFDTCDSPSIGGGDARRKYHPSWVSHGLVVSNVSDMSKFFDSVFRQKFIAGNLAKYLRKPKPLDFPGGLLKPHYGFGVMGDPHSEVGLVLGHDGGGPGFTVSAFHQEKGKMVRDLFLVIGKEGIQGIDVLAKLIRCDT